MRKQSRQAQMARVRIAVAGAGLIGLRHIEETQKSQSAKLSAIVDPSPSLKYYEKEEERSWYKPFKAETIRLERADPLARQIEHFAAVIRGDAKPLVTGRDGLQNLRVTDAIAEAAKSGKTVEVAIN